jgi:hypothetical protein
MQQNARPRVPAVYAVFALDHLGHWVFRRYVLSGEAHALRLLPGVLVQVAEIIEL